MGRDLNEVGDKELKAMSRDVAGSSRQRAAGFALSGALLLVIAGLLRERYLVAGLLGAPGAILFLAGAFTMVFGSNAAQKKGLGWSLLRIGFGLISLLALVIAAALVLRAVR